MSHLLCSAHQVIAVLRQGFGGGRIPHNHRPEKHHQIGFFARPGFALEQIAKDRNVAQDRYFFLISRVFILEQATKHHHRPVVNQHVGLNRPLVGDQARAGVDRGGLHAADFLKNLQFDRTVFADLGSDPKRQAHIFSFNRLKRIDRTIVAAGVGEGAGHERHVLANHNARLLVVERQQIGCRQDVAVAIGFKEARQKAEHRHAVLACHTEVQSRRRLDRARSSLCCQGEDVGAAYVEVGAQQTVFSKVALKLNTELGSFVAVNLCDQAFNEHLSASGVELVDDGPQLPVLRLRRGDDQRVGGGVGLDLPAGRWLRIGQTCRQVAAAGSHSTATAGRRHEVRR